MEIDNRLVLSHFCLNNKQVIWDFYCKHITNADFVFVSWQDESGPVLTAEHNGRKVSYMNTLRFYPGLTQEGVNTIIWNNYLQEKRFKSLLDKELERFQHNALYVGLGLFVLAILVYVALCIYFLN